jgi:hypothetical protein
MKKLLLILLCLPMFGFGQKTYVPDNLFEYSLEGMGMGDGIPLNDSVWTSAIDTLTFLDISVNLGTPIASLIGIEDFVSLQHLEIKFQNIDSIDLSENLQLTYIHLRDNNLFHVDVKYLTSLEFLILDENQITEIDLTDNNNLIYFACQDNQIISLDLSENYFLQSLDCWNNQITSLDLSNNSWIFNLNCENNQLVILNLRNNNNSQMTEFKVQGNYDLFCINVDDSTWSANNWNFLPQNNIDPWHYFSENCNATTNIKEHSANKELLKVTDLLARETKGTKNEPLFYIYDDGTVEKRIVIE